MITADWRSIVGRIADSYMGLQAYAEIGYLSRLIGESLAMSGVQIETDGDLRHVAALYRQLKETPEIGSVQSRTVMIEQLMETLLQNQFIFIGLITLFSGIVFFGSIVNSSMVNLAERQREVATFLALGYSQQQIGGMFLRESMLTNMTGTVLGLPVGWLLMWLAATSYSNDLIRMPVVSAVWIWVTTLV